MWFLYLIIGFGIFILVVLLIGFIQDPQGMMEISKPDPSKAKITKGIKCPNCGDTNTRRISGANKAVSVATTGVLAANKLKNSWECKKCGYRW